MSQAQIPAPVEDPAKDPAKRPVKVQMDNLLQKKDVLYLDEAYLASIGIKLTTMDFETGMPEDEGPILIELLPIDLSDAIERDTDLRHDEEVRPITKLQSVVGNLHVALSLSYFFTSGLFRSNFKTTNKPILDCSPWDTDKWCLPTNYVRLFKSESFDCFSLRLPGKSLPDTMCFLAHDAPYKDDVLYTKELAFILQHGLGKLWKKRHQNQQTAAVTIISGSGRKVRIVQGYVNRDGCVFVRKTAFVDVNDTDEKNFERLIQITRWMLGSPCRKQPISPNPNSTAAATTLNSRS